jgi:hypothetical protein
MLLTALNPADVCDLDDEIPVSDELIFVLIQEVLQLARFVTFIPSERVNDGADDSKAVVNNVPNFTPTDEQMSPPAQ